MLLFSLVDLQVGLIKQKTTDLVASAVLTAVYPVIRAEIGIVLFFHLGISNFLLLTTDRSCHNYCECEETAIKVPRQKKKSSEAHWVCFYFLPVYTCSNILSVQVCVPVFGHDHAFAILWVEQEGLHNSRWVSYSVAWSCPARKWFTQ